MKLVVFGNMLLDMVLPVSRAFLDDYNLTPDSTTLAKGEHLEIFQKMRDVGQNKPVYLPGGCAANTARIAKWMLKNQRIVVFVGALGDDEDSKLLLNLMKNSEIDMSLCQISKNSTVGKCAVLVTESSRTLLTNLGASLLFNDEAFRLSYTPDILQLDMTHVIYFSGFFMKVSSPTVQWVAEKASCKNSSLSVFNLNAVWIVEEFHSQINDLLQHIDILMGNEQEIMALGKSIKKYNNAEQDIYSFGSHLSSSLKKGGFQTVIVTRGNQDVLTITGKTTQHYPVLSLPNSLIVDTNGAGDAFAGGFLAGLMKKLTFDQCIYSGLWAACHVLQHAGCTFSEDVVLPEYLL